MADATFRAGGLASGLDSNTIIDKLIELESRPVSILRTRQSAVKTQISKLAEIKSKLSDLSSIAKSLGTGGTVATTVSTGHTGFDAVTGAGAVAGRHTIEVTALAAAASGLSTPFASGSAPVNAGRFDFTVMGKDYGFDVTPGSSLADVAFQIRQSGAPISATVISDGSQSYISLINNETGNPAVGNALSVNDPSNILGLTLKPAASAGLTIDGLPIVRQTNSVSDVIPGVTINLKKLTTGAEETVVVGNDNTGTKANVAKFVDAYNGILKLVQAQLASVPGSDRASSLAGDSALRGLQSSVQGLLTTKVTDVETATVRALADIGLKTARDGTLSIDTDVLTRRWPATPTRSTSCSRRRPPACPP